MPTALSWRIVGMSTYGGGSLHVSAAHLYDVDDVRIDAPATLTCSHEVSGGALDNLQDTDLLTTCTLANVADPGFFLRWDFPTATEVASMRFGGGISKVGFPRSVALECMVGGTWVPVATASALAFPGVSSINLPSGGGGAFDPLLGGLLLAGDGFEGGEDFSDTGPWGLPITKTGTVTTSDSAARFGTSIRFDAGGYLSCGHPNMAFGTGDFTITWWQKAYTADFDPGAFQLSDTPGGLKPSTSSLAVFWTYPGKWAIYKGDGIALSPANHPVPGVMVHVALVRASGIMTLYVDGSVAWQGASTVNFGYQYLVVGAYHSAAYKFPGSVDDFAVLPGVALYLAPFTPPDAPLGGTPPLDHGPSVPTAALALRTSNIDAFGGGPYSLEGTVSNVGTPNSPVRRRIRLHNQRDAVLVREVWSSSSGSYKFAYISAGTYYVMSLDHTGQYGAVIESDIVVPAP